VAVREYVRLGERVVGTGGPGTGRGTDDFARIPEPGGEHPLVQALAGMGERRFTGLWLAGAEAVEGDREVADPGL
jgi:hypothetical protein